VLEEVFDGLALHGVEIIHRFPVRVQRQDFVGRYRQHLAIDTGLVLHLEDAQWAARHHHTGRQGHGL
jgi:hypothetical protein